MMDQEHLNSLCSLLGRSQINQIRLVYVEESSQTVTKLLNAWEEKHYEDIATLSHSIKSASLNMGLTTLSKECQQLETSAPLKEDEVIQDIMNNLLELHATSLKELEAYFIGK